VTQLTAAQQTQCAAYWANVNFVTAQVTANFSLDQISAAAAALDNAFDTTLSAAVTAVGGGTTVINGLNAIIPAPFSGATVQQKTLLCCYVLMKRAGII
jgi:hypothetical protein